MGPKAEKQLAEAIRRTHGVEAVFVEAVPVHETFKGETIWEGIVHVFDLKEHPTAKRCYAWAELVDEVTGREKHWAVLHQGPVGSPLAAVRAAIIQGYREQRESDA